MEHLPEQPLIELDRWMYMVDNQTGHHVVRLSGYTKGHPKVDGKGRVFVSSPVKFDEEEKIVTTSSGKRYKLMECDGNEKEHIEYIRMDVKRYSERTRRNEM